MGKSALTSAFLIGSMAFGATGAFGQTLEEALIEAYQSNPTLASARTGVKSVDERVPQALSNWRPSVTLSGSGGIRRTDTDAPTGDSNDTTHPASAELEITQFLYRGGRTIAATEQAENEVLAERASLQSVEQDVLLRAVSAYADVWRDQAVLDLNINNERVLTRQLEATRDRFEVGELTRTDVAQSESRLSTAVAQRIASEGDLNTSRAVYEEVVGSKPGTLEQPSPFATLPPTLDELLAIALERNPALLSARFNQIAAEKQVREVEGELYPVVALTGSVSHNDETSGKDIDSTTGEILATVTVPIYQQGSVSSRVRQAKQDANQRRIQITEQIRAVEQDGVSAWEDLLSARAQIESLRAAVTAAEVALEGVRQEEEVGERTILDVLDAEQELLDAQVSLVRAQRDQVVATYQVLSAMGQMTASYIELPVDHYDPQEHYNEVRDKWFGLDVEK